MLSDYALMSFSVLQSWTPDLRDADQEFLENYINAASLRIRDYLGYEVVRKQYTEVHNCRTEIKLKNDNVISVTSVKYDPSRLWTGDTTVTLDLTDDYYWIEGSQIINLISLIAPLYYRNTIQVVYTAGKYPLKYQQVAEPAEPYANEAWRNSFTGEVKLYDGTSWSVISGDLVVNDLILNALVETILFYKNRVFQNSVGARSVQGSSQLSYYQQMELSLPQNVKDMLDGQGVLL